MFQSTPPYGGRPARPSRRCRAGRVSIHAPVWGATGAVEHISQDLGVSIHAPVWGATSALPNPHRPLPVSIHAPVWGATHSAFLVSFDTEVSIHAPVWGATQGIALIVVAGMFQSTPPYGGRPMPSSTTHPSRSFNPRPRMGGDMDYAYYVQNKYVSIHAPVWGATRRVSTHTISSMSFNPRPRMGGDLPLICCCQHPCVSIHAPVWGATKAAVMAVTAVEFQSTPPYGGRPETAGRLK